MKGSWFNILAATLLVLGSLSRCQDAVVLERESLRRLPARDFLELRDGLADNFGYTFNYSQSTRGLHLFEQEISAAIVPEPVAKSMVFTNSSVDFTFSTVAFQVDITYLFDYAVLAFPITGLCKLRLYVAQTVYSLRAAGNSIIPAMSPVIQFAVLSVGNPAAALMGIHDILIPMSAKVLAPHYDTLLKTLMLSRIAPMYQATLAQRVSYVRYPYLHGSIVRLQDALTSVSVSKDGLALAYNESAGQEAAHAAVAGEDDALKEVTYSGPALAKIVQQALSHIKDFTLATPDILPESNFKLDLQSLQHMFPEILLENTEGHVVTLKLNGRQSEVKGVANKERQEIAITGIKLDLNIYLHHRMHEALSATVQLDLAAKPTVVCNSTDCSYVYLSLYADSARTVVLSAESKVREPALFNKRGVADFVTAFVQNYLVRHFATFPLGAGILISTGTVIDPGKSFATVTDRGVTAVLYAASTSY